MKLANDLVVFDLETTGTWVDRDKIIEIALIKTSPSGEETTYESRVNPGMSIPQAVVELTGILNVDVHDAPKFKDIVKEVVAFIGEADMAGYNLERFDLPVLERECNEAGHEFKWRERNIFDAQKVYHLNEKRDLTAAYKFYCQKDLNDAHSAMADTRATLDILLAQVDRYIEKDGPVSELQQFQYRVSQEFYDDERKFRWWNGKLYIMFGKYAGKYSLQEVVKKDRGYLQWILSSNFSDRIKVLVEEALLGNLPVQEIKTD
ncbi:MAG: DNA polymerase-3 subunit epsilon [Lysobacterales bacterium]|jgi:DNA polymerase-3 subunit epsilon